MTTHLAMTRQCESLGNLGLPSFPSSEELNTFELDVVSKFDTIINVLRELEDQFTQARYEVLHKTKLEGKEGGKICAIKGRVIQNKQKYYRSIEGEIQSLMKIYNDQFNKISKEFTCLKVVSGIEEKVELETPTTTSTIKEIQSYTTIPVPRPETYHHNELQSTTSPFVKSITVPSLKRIDSNPSSSGKKPISIGAVRPVPRPLFKASSTTEIEISKKYETINMNNYNRQQRQQNLIEIPEGPLNIPEDVEGEENQSNQVVNRVRRGLMTEINSVQTLQNNRPIRSAKSHGFRLTYHVPSDSREDILMELPICGNN